MFYSFEVILKVHGKAVHSGYPHLGDSAIDKLLDILHDIRTHEWPSDKTFGLHYLLYLYNLKNRI